MSVSARTVGWIALVAGVVGLVSIASLIVFFIVGGPFGSINDWTIALLGVLSASLVLGLESARSQQLPAAGPVIAAVGVLGAVIVVIGAGLVISQTTGFVLAGLVESLGFALVGVWLIAVNRRTGWPAGTARLGLAAGVLMAVGFAVLPGIVARTDRMEDIPAIVWLGWVGWLGIFVLYPIWGIRLGRSLGAAA
jgi:hypothetical protein